MYEQFGVARAGWRLGISVCSRSAAVGSFALLALACTSQSGFVGYAVPPGQGGTGGPGQSGSGPDGANLLKTSTFDDGRSVPWTTSFTAPADGSAEVKNGAYCVTVKNVGSKRWDAQFRHREMTIQKGHYYTVKFRAWASAPTKARLKVGMSGPPYAEYWSSVIELTTASQPFSARFTMNRDDDATAEFAFHIGGDMALAKTPFELCIDDVELDDPAFVPPKASASSAPVPPIAVNQLGYLPHTIKLATLKSGGSAAEAWTLIDRDGKVLQKGETKPFGADAASGDEVKLIDFSVAKPGTGLSLKVGEHQSYPFDIAPTIYKQLKYDALAFFYQQRSGIEITAALAGKPELARPAAHLSDKSVKCLPGSGCDYSLDVSGGWYDAGDHGKYVVNGGISVWTLLDQYERAKYLGSSSADFADGKLKIPENHNHVPDLLDEARWELEFMLKMQVPEGKPLAGMVHHKVHDAEWTGLGLAPHEDKQTRFLHKPSTAATLNLAATAAQAARIWKPIDPAFATRCLEAAERAYVAAKQNPALLAPKEDTTGGGAYEDDKVDDEFYWAAAELYVTTAKPEYKQAIDSSPLNQRFRIDAGAQTSSLTWQVTDALGMISLAVVPSKLPPAAQKALRTHLVEAADRYLKIEEGEGYRVPFGHSAGYPWGSNSFVVNNVIVLALANDFTKQQKYLDGAVLGMDYLLGRNPLGQSYVTGYGDKPLQHPHHRFWARQADAKFPSAPAGLLSGGPNSSLQDPYAKGSGLGGCAPEKCFVDHIEAYSVNEVAINWNAPLAWAAAWLDEKGEK